jgi:quercetin dioxygenase-like cupin family protein
MTRVAVLLGLGLLLVASGYAQQDDPRFTGKSVVMDGKELTVARRSFEAGARSAWHSHDNGQLLMVEDGRMRTQKKGAAIKELGKGESDYTGPKIVHWHGAVPGQMLVQINVGFGGETRWMEKVTDAEYEGKK